MFQRKELSITRDETDFENRFYSNLKVTKTTECMPLMTNPKLAIQQPPRVGFPGAETDSNEEVNASKTIIKIKPHSEDISL